MTQDINRHNMIMRAFEEHCNINWQPAKFDLTVIYGKYSTKYIDLDYFYKDSRTKMAFFNFRDGFEAGYKARQQEEI